MYVSFVSHNQWIHLLNGLQPTSNKLFRTSIFRAPLTLLQLFFRIKHAFSTSPVVFVCLGFCLFVNGSVKFTINKTMNTTIISTTNQCKVMIKDYETEWATSKNPSGKLIVRIIDVHFNTNSYLFVLGLVHHWFNVIKRPSLSFGSWIYNYLCNQCTSPLTLWVRIMSRCTWYHIMW